MRIRLPSRRIQGPMRSTSTDRYWWCCGPDGWWIETWRGEPSPENVVIVCRVLDLDDAEAIVKELNDGRG